MWQENEKTPVGTLFLFHQKQKGDKGFIHADEAEVHRAVIYNEVKRGGEPYRAAAAQKAL